MRVELQGALATNRPAAARAARPFSRFSLSSLLETRGSSTVARPAAASALDALLALQSEGDATERRKRVVRRGHALLDALDGLKLAALSGDGGAGELSRLSAALRQEETAADDPVLGDLIGQIELRAAVEIAKRRPR